MTAHTGSGFEAKQILSAYYTVAADTHMILEAMTALLSFPLVISHRFSRSRITVTRKRFSCSSSMEPLMEPMAQHRVFKPFQDSSRPFCSWDCACRHQYLARCIVVPTLGICRHMTSGICFAAAAVEPAVCHKHTQHTFVLGCRTLMD